MFQVTRYRDSVSFSLSLSVSRVLSEIRYIGSCEFGVSDFGDFRKSETRLHFYVVVLYT